MVQGSPDSESLLKAAFDKYLAGARVHRGQVEGVDLSIESFDPVLRMGIASGCQRIRSSSKVLRL